MFLWRLIIIFDYWIFLFSFPYRWLEFLFKFGRIGRVDIILLCVWLSWVFKVIFWAPLLWYLIVLVHLVHWVLSVNCHLIPVLLIIETSMLGISAHHLRRCNVLVVFIRWWGDSWSVLIVVLLGHVHLRVSYLGYASVKQCDLHLRTVIIMGIHF
jgi:hypothetical protein